MGGPADDLTDTFTSDLRRRSQPNGNPGVSIMLPCAYGRGKPCLRRESNLLSEMWVGLLPMGLHEGRTVSGPIESYLARYPGGKRHRAIATHPVTGSQGALFRQVTVR